MSKTPKTHELIANNIRFTEHAIVYEVDILGGNNEVKGVIMSNNDIKEKDLILKTTYFDNNRKEIVFTPVNATPFFYQGLYNKTLYNIDEYISELDAIYDIGDVVGFVLES